jgi:hypothetical protein
MNYCITYNKALYPSLKKCPDSRMIEMRYTYIPQNMITQADGLSSGDNVELVIIPQKGDIICTVVKSSGGGSEYQVFWKDLVRL